MARIRASIDVDLDDIIDELDVDDLFEYIDDKDLLLELKKRNLSPAKEDECFAFKSKADKKCFLLKLFELNSHTTNEQLINIIKENIS